MSLESMNSNNSDQNIPDDVFRNLVDDFSLGKFEDVSKEISTLMAEFPNTICSNRTRNNKFLYFVWITCCANNSVMLS